MFTVGQNRTHTEGPVAGVCVPPRMPSCLLRLAMAEGGNHRTEIHHGVREP